MPVISISVQNRQAIQTDSTPYICGNGDYEVKFAFDSEWDAFPVKTARFQSEGWFTDVLFRGDGCPVPALDHIRQLEVGVYAGNIQTTTPARVYVQPGIRTVWGSPEEPAPSVYDQIMDAFRDTGVTLRQTQEGAELTVRHLGGVSTAFVRHSEVYVGPGEMPEGYVVQVDPTGNPAILKVRNYDGTALVIPAIQGEKGEKGDKGDPGPQGPKGDAGENLVRVINGVLPDSEGNLLLTPEDLQAVARKGSTMEGNLNLNGWNVTGLGTPADSGDAASKAYVDGKHRILEVVLLPASWSGDSAPYSQTVALEGILESDSPHYGVVLSGTTEEKLARKEAFGYIDQLETADGAITFTCLEDKPEVSLTIQLEVNR